MPTSAFGCSFREVGDLNIVALTGEIDLAVAWNLRKCLAKVPTTDVIVDARNLEFMDSTGLACLIRLSNRLQASGHQLRVTRPHPIVKRILEVSGMDTYLVDFDPSWDYRQPPLVA